MPAKKQRRITSGHSHHVRRQGGVNSTTRTTSAQAKSEQAELSQVKNTQARSDLLRQQAKQTAALKGMAKRRELAKLTIN